MDLLSGFPAGFVPLSVDAHVRPCGGFRNDDIHAAHRVVQDVDDLHVQGAVAVDGQAVKELADRLHRVFAAFLHAVAVGVGQGDLSGLCSGVKAVSVKDGNFRHGIPVDADDADRFFSGIQDHKEQGVGLSALIKVFGGLHLSGFIDAHDKKGHHIVFIGVGFSLIAKLAGP